MSLPAERQSYNWPDNQSPCAYDAQRAWKKSNRKEGFKLSFQLIFKLPVLLFLDLLKRLLKVLRLRVKFLFTILLDLHSQYLDVKEALLLICLLNHILHNYY